MNIMTTALAAALALTSSLAVAQNVVVEPGAAPERPVVVAPDGPRSIDPAGTIQADKTVGEAPPRPATPGVVPGARDKSRTGGEGVSDRPAGN
jgi:hypothetical protein